MKKVEAIVRPHKVEELHHALLESGFSGLTVSEVRGYGRQKGHKEVYRGSEYNIEFVPKVKVEIVCPDQKVETAVDTILNKCKTGEIGDGKIFIYSIEDAIRIRTSESGDSAV